LLAIVAHVRCDHLVGKRWSCIIAAGGVADFRREVADQQDHAMPELDELLHLVQHDGVAEVEERARGIHAEFYDQAALGRDARFELGRRLDMIAAGGQNAHLFARRDVHCKSHKSRALFQDSRDGASRTAR
jgi:hypothetical protein